MASIYSYSDEQPLGNIQISSTGLLDPTSDQPPVDGKRCPVPQEHPNLSLSVSNAFHHLARECRITCLHHPPIHHIISLQLPIKNSNLKNRHPSKQPNLKEREREEVGFGGSVDGFRSILTRHWRYGEVLEDDADQECEAVVCFRAHCQKENR